MRIATVPHAPGTLKQPLTAMEIAAICARVFGTAEHISTVEELSGGTINTVYRLHCRAQPPCILRVAPSEQHPALFRHEHHLLRTEYVVQPFLAPVGHRLPDIVFVDFTQQLVARDFIVHTAIAGDVWRDVVTTLTPAEQLVLWQQLGVLTRQIHGVGQAQFGPAHAPHFDHWSEALLADFTAAQLDFAVWNLPTEPLVTVQSFLATQRPVFDCLPAAHLLHGDLWLNNLLVQRTANGPQIVGVLDAGFAQWGDPAADWTLMRMVLTPPSGAAAFWEGYGPVDSDQAAELRSAVYQARMLAWAVLELTRRQDPKRAQLVQQLVSVSERLSA